PRIEGQDFDALPSKEATVSFLRELGHTRVINSFNDVVIDQIHQCPQMKESKAYKTYLGYATDEEHVQKGKRVKRSAKKSSTTLTTGIIIREPPVETQSKRKEKVDVARGKGIDMLSKSLRDFHKCHPSGSGLVAEKSPSVKKITPPVISEGTGDKPGVPDVTKDEST
nr:hypothetical protein [Tanacetum cinerariifolium]